MQVLQNLGKDKFSPQSFEQVGTRIAKVLEKVSAPTSACINVMDVSTTLRKKPECTTAKQCLLSLDLICFWFLLYSIYYS